MSQAEWYYTRQGQSIGPYDIDALRSMIASGTITWQDYVWRPGMPQWAAAFLVPGLNGSAVNTTASGEASTSAVNNPAASYAAAGNSGASTPDASAWSQNRGQSAGYQQSGYQQSVYAAPGAGQFPAQMNYYSPSPYARVRYAGFWLRFWAYLLDSLILAIPVFLVLLAVNVAFGFGQRSGSSPFAGMSMADPAYWRNQAIGIVIAWIYFASMESSRFQATLGKMALGLKVTDEQGRRISFGRASGRQLGKCISQLTLLIGFIMAAFTERKQALHDLMAHCLVIRSRG